MKLSKSVQTIVRSLVFALLVTISPALAQKAFAGDKLPYDAGTTQIVTQGWNGTTSHSTYGKAIGFGMVAGTNVRAVTSGTVVFAGWVDKNAQGYCPVSCWLNGFGNAVYIQSTDGSKHDIYAHMSELSVSNGQSITQGQLLGKSGSSGWGASGPHLNFQRKLDSIAGVPGNSVEVTFDENSSNQPWTSKNSGTIKVLTNFFVVNQNVYFSASTDGINFG
jgi:murein DD-endopeptidase MepM/ murein hydrolase activator NlpD